VTEVLDAYKSQGRELFSKPMQLAYYAPSTLAWETKRRGKMRNVNNFHTDYQAKKNIGRYLAGINRELDQCEGLGKNPVPLKAD
jgi:hypothetical protein